MSFALINRMFHVQLVPDAKAWLNWAYENNLHHWLLDYITQRPDHLFTEPPKTGEPYSTPRSWHMLNDALYQYHVGEGEEKFPQELLRILVYGTVSAKHAGLFIAFSKNVDNKYLLNDIIKGE